MTHFAKPLIGFHAWLIAAAFLLVTAGWLLASGLGSEPIAEGVSFQRDIAPIISSKCLGCHSGPEPKGGLDLQSRAGLLAGGESGKVFEPTSAAASLIAEYIEQGKMPPKKPLDELHVRLLKRWIVEGAQWEDSIKLDPLQYSSDDRAGLDWWSLQPIRRPDLPVDVLDQWSINSVDSFVYSKLVQRGLSPSSPVIRNLLARRLWFDLLGTPPAPEDIEEFVEDSAPDAYERLVDRLLASPEYGAHWTRHWLDIAHFGESDGFEFDKLRPHAWPYRDWVIDALNRDLKYDDFAKQQIAGDLLSGDLHSIPATGFLVAGPHDSLKPAVESMRLLMRQDELEDLTALIGQSFLGLTVQCARCHDHKFDPIRQSDYYRFAATFAGVQRGNRNVASAEKVHTFEQQLSALRQHLETLERPARESALKARAVIVDGESGLKPFQEWDFRNSASIEAMNLSLNGDASLGTQGLMLNGVDAYASTPPLARAIRAKTLEAWVTLSNLKQRGGAVLSLQSLDGDVFDAIVFGEQAAAQWLAGSDRFNRTQPLNGPDETRSSGPVHLAVTYSEDGQIVFYRDGQALGESFKTSLATFEVGTSQVVFGLRHSPVTKAKLLTGTIHRARLHERALSAQEIEESSKNDGKFVAEEEIAEALSVTQRHARSALLLAIRQQRDQLRRERDKQTFAIIPQPAPIVRVLERGSPLLPRETVNPGDLSAFEKLPNRFELAADSDDVTRRLGLAQWIASKQNPLFARVIVNRLWQHHFGQGLILTPNDLGFNGGQPSHAELLDWLSSELIEHDFSLKSIHRLIVTSATYRQSSQGNEQARRVDADNLLLWRNAPQRLSAEAIRDAMLSVAGQLNRVGGGPGYQDFRPFLRGGTQFFEPLDPQTPDAHRRTVYRTWARGGTSSMLDVFDCPDPSTLTPRRNSTNTPLQALAMLNNSFSMRMAERFAERLDRESVGDLALAIRRGYLLAYSRNPEPEEIVLSRDFIERTGLRAWCRVLLNSNEFLYLR